MDDQHSTGTRLFRFQDLQFWKKAFKNANMTIVFHCRGLNSAYLRAELLYDFEEECRMITDFIRGLQG
jgi:hypothetical protein